jgi:hypothetical protein
MKKLERLTQDRFGHIYNNEGEIINNSDLYMEGQIKTIVIEHPCLSISEKIEKMAENGSSFIPENANCYIASEFNPETQHVKEKECGTKKFYSVHAVQFYTNLPF